MNCFSSFFCVGIDTAGNLSVPMIKDSHLEMTEAAWYKYLVYKLNEFNSLWSNIICFLEDRGYEDSKVTDI